MENFTTTRPYSLEELSPLLSSSHEEIKERLGSRFLVMWQARRQSLGGTGSDLRTTTPGGPDHGEHPPASCVTFTVQPLKLGEGGGGSLVVGRDPTADIQLEDRTVSRRHAALGWFAGEVVVSDLFSSNGTFVDGHRIQPGVEGSVHVVRLGGQLIFGVCECVLFDVQRLSDLASVMLRPNGAEPQVRAL